MHVCMDVWMYGCKFVRTYVACTILFPRGLCEDLLALGVREACASLIAREACASPSARGHIFLYRKHIEKQSFFHSMIFTCRHDGHVYACVRDAQLFPSGNRQLVPDAVPKRCPMRCPLRFPLGNYRGFTHIKLIKDEALRILNKATFVNPR